MKFSIAMTSYNGEKYIREQIGSILSQTISDFELIICDDRSKDATFSIISDYASHDSRIKVYQNQINLGFKKNFEKAISLCYGEYIALSDQDDIWTEDHLEILYRGIGDNSLICGNNLLTDDNGNSTGISFFESNCFSKKQYPTDTDVLRKIMFSGSCFQGASMLMKKEFSDIVLPIPEAVKYHDTWLTTLACLNDSFAWTDEIVTHYRQHSSQVTKNASVTNDFSTMRIALLENASKLVRIPQDLLNEISYYHSNQHSPLFRLKTIPIWKTNYKYIYPKGNHYIYHLVKYIFKGLY